MLRRFVGLSFIALSSTAFAADWSRPFASPAEISAGYEAKVLEIGPANPEAFFARIYAEVTEEVRAMLDRHEFKNEDWVRGLMLNYANLYRQAFYEHEIGHSSSAAWAKAFAENDRVPAREASFQLLISINAHVNRDLPYALVLTKTDFSRQDLFADFKRISESFRRRMPHLWGLLHEYDRCGRPWIEREGVLLLMNRIMSIRRQLAWDNGRRLQERANDPKALAAEEARLEAFTVQQVDVIEASFLTRIEHSLCGPANKF